jgi:hypothetical protein
VSLPSFLSSSPLSLPRSTPAHPSLFH